MTNLLSFGGFYICHRASALYQNCGSFPSTSHASSPTGEKTLTQLLSISGAYSTQQVREDVNDWLISKLLFIYRYIDLNVNLLYRYPSNFCFFSLDKIKK